MDNVLAKLAEAYGIAPGYVSESGEHRITSDAAKRGVLLALGVTQEEPVVPPRALSAHSAPSAEASQCFIPDWLQDGRAWGVSCQLYGLRSNRNAGIGDFEDLARFSEVAGGVGADFVGVNPLHALFTADPRRCSPYSPSSRRFLNPVYIALDRVGASTSPELERARASDLVDYPTVGRLKTEALAVRFRELGDAAFELPAERTFKEFTVEGGDALRLFALFEALSESVVGNGGHAGWHTWPAALQSRSSPEVEAFAESNDDLIRFHVWLQWIADAQLAVAHQRALAAGMRIGLYLDLAVGVAPDGAETWIDRASVVAGVRIGSPPDPFNEHGQDWGLAPLSPVALREKDCDGFVSVIEAAMRNAGAVRIDHVMGLMRLYWIPDGARADDGAYVHYPLDDLIRHLATASHRHRAVVVGEDLGTVPPGFRDVLRSAEVQGYRVLYFERDGNSFRDVGGYPREAIACVSTHDLPTLRGWWSGIDIAARVQAGICSAEGAAGWRSLRDAERHALVARLAASGLLTGDIIAFDPDHIPDEVSIATHRFLSRTPARLLAIQVEDLLGMPEQANLPGTINEHPNWCRKLPCTIEALGGHDLFRKITAAMAEERPRRP